MALPADFDDALDELARELAEALAAEGRRAAAAPHRIEGRPVLVRSELQRRWEAAGGSLCWQVKTASLVVLILTHPEVCPWGQAFQYSAEMAERDGLAGRELFRDFPIQLMRARVLRIALEEMLRRLDELEKRRTRFHAPREPE